MADAARGHGRERVVALLLCNRWQCVLGRWDCHCWPSACLVRIVLARYQLGCTTRQRRHNLVATIPTEGGTIIYRPITSRTNHDLLVSFPDSCATTILSREMS